jgi:hypothetical protein
MSIEATQRLLSPNRRRHEKTCHYRRNCHRPECCRCFAGPRAGISLTLKKIKDTGSITLGHRESSIPFSYYDDKQQVIGYSHELMLKVVDRHQELS